MKTKMLIIALLLLGIDLQAQQEVKKFSKLNSVQIELSGAEHSFVPISINFERILFQTRKHAWNAKVGGLYKPWGKKPQTAVTAEIGLISQGKRHHWEAGVFAMYHDQKKFLGENRSQGLISPPFYLATRGGYRFQPANSTWLIRAGFILPFLQSTAKEGENQEYVLKFRPQYLIIPWPSIAIGKAF